MMTKMIDKHERLEWQTNENELLHLFTMITATSKNMCSDWSVQTPIKKHSHLSNPGND